MARSLMLPLDGTTERSPTRCSGAQMVSASHTGNRRCAGIKFPRFKIPKVSLSLLYSVARSSPVDGIPSRRGRSGRSNGRRAPKHRC